MIADDLFAGAGGWDLAARWLGIHARGIENMAAARATRAAAGLETVHDDVWTYVPDRRARLKIASPPCQTFSISGHGSGRKALKNVLDIIPFVADMSLDDLRCTGEHLGDDRTALVLTPLWFALHCDHYQEIAWEQVPTVQPVWDTCAVELREHGWHVATGRLQSEQYGVAQTRRRSVLLGSRSTAVALPVPTHSRYHNQSPDRLDPRVLKWRSMSEVLDMGAEDIVRSNYGTGGDPARRGCRNGSQPAAAVTSKAGRNLVYVNGTHDHAARRSVTAPAPTVMFGARSNAVTWQLASGTRAKAAARQSDQPSPTLAFGHDAASYVFAPTGMSPAETVGWKAGGGIRVTVREAGILQSFPGDYPWQGRAGEQYLQVGNAVPPLLAMAVLAALYPERALI